MSDVDVVCVGGGIGGAALAATLAKQGLRVVVLERTLEFSDRVRGEVLVPWGLEEARKLGLLEPLAESCGHEVLFWEVGIGGATVLRRDLRETNEQGLPVLTYHHPPMQDLMLKLAEKAGARIFRGARVRRVEPSESGGTPSVFYELDGESMMLTARLVVGADGRGSPLRKAGGFYVRTHEAQRMFGGVLLENVESPEDTMCSRFDPARGLMSWVFPQGNGRARVYIGYNADSGIARLQGDKDLGRFIDLSESVGVPHEAFKRASMAGPLATFDATDNWVELPYNNGIALIGDAAMTSDPTWGQGMSLTLRDVRLLSEALAADSDWNAAGRAYAHAHQQGHNHVLRADHWYTGLFLGVGTAADEIREQAFPRLLADPSLMPGTPFAGPSVPADDAARIRFLGA